MGKTNLPRLVAYADNPQVVAKLEEFCKQKRCSTSQGINQLLEQALGLASLNSMADVPSASTNQLVANTYQKEIEILKSEFKNLRSAVSELRLTPSAVASASTVDTSTDTANGIAKLVSGTLASTVVSTPQINDGIAASTADSIDSKASTLEAIQSNLSELREEVKLSREDVINELREDHQQIADSIQELIEWKEEIQNQEDENQDFQTEYSPIDETTQNLQAQIDELNQELKQAKDKAEEYYSYYQLWRHVFPKRLTSEEICRYSHSDHAWVRTRVGMTEAFKIFVS